MVKCREYLIEGRGMFKVITRHVKDNKPVMAEHILSFKKGKWHCDCKGYNYSKPVYKNGKPKDKMCQHIDFIKHELKRHNWGILRYESNFDWMEHLKVETKEVE